MNLQNKYIKIANKRFIQEVDSNLRDYNIEFKDEKDKCKVIYVPKKIKLGGGAEIIIDKRSLVIEDLVKYQ